MDQITEQFEYGDKVEHPVFGIGQVLAFIGDGERLKLLIKFRDHGEKKVAVRHARLKRLSDRPTLTAAAAIAAPRLDVEAPKAAVRKTVLAAADVTKGFHNDVDHADDEDDEDIEMESLEEIEEDEEDEDEG